MPGKTKNNSKSRRAPAGPLYLLDASVYVFRAWFALPDSFHTPDGRPVNAVYGYTRFLLEFLARTRARQIVAAFDESLTGSFRNRLYPAYKANRESAPDDLKEQFRLCRRMTEALGITALRSARYEADDLLGTLAARYPGRKIIVTRDKDLAQLLKKNDLWWDYAADLRYDSNGVRTRFGVKPAQLADYLGLTGDAVDNIPGVPGIGPKTAVALLTRWPDLERIYAGLAQVASLPVRGAAALADKLAAHRQQAFLSRTLATIKCDIVFQKTPVLQRAPLQQKRFIRLCNELGFGDTLRHQAARIDAGN